MLREVIAAALGFVVTTSAAVAATSTVSPGPYARARDARSGTSTVAFTIKISRATASKAPALRRARPLYVSPSTDSLTLLVDGANPTSFNVTRTSPICYANDFNVYTCRIALHVAPGVHTFTVEAFDGLNSTGNLLSQNTTGPITVAATGTTYVPLALDGIVAKVAFSPSIPVPDIGVSTTISLNVVAYDADGNIIIGGAPFYTPIEITLAPQGALTLKNAITSPADASALTAAYPGTDVSNIVIRASVAGKPVGATTLTPMPRTTAKLYVEPYGERSVQVYRTSNLALPPATISLFNYPGLAADPAAGRLFAFDYISFKNVAFDLSTLARLPGSFSLPGQVAAIAGVADDSTGLLYSRNGFGFGTSVFSIVSVDPRNGYQIATVIPSSGAGPLALDPLAHRLYVGHSTFGNPGDPPSRIDVYELKNGAAIPVDTISTSPTLHITGMAIDAVTGKLYVSSAGNVLVYSTKPGHTILETIGGLSGVFGLADDAVHARLYVAEGSDNETHPNDVRIYATNAGNALVGALKVPFYYQTGAIAVVP